MRVLGVDPGSHGAFAIYDTVYQSLSVVDMPAWNMVVGRTKRRRVDAVELADLFDLWAPSIHLLVIEQVGGYRRMRGHKASLYLQGFNIGLIYMAAIQARVPVETIAAAVWKRVLRIPKDEQGIAKRFQEIFPMHRGLIYGPRGAILHDRAEAALIAKYAADYMLANILPGTDWRLKSREADVGA